MGKYTKGDIVEITTKIDSYVAVVYGSHQDIMGKRYDPYLYEIFEIGEDGKLIKDPITMSEGWMDPRPDLAETYNGKKLLTGCKKIIERSRSETC